MLNGIRVVEFAAIGPVPFCAMLLAANGAQITRIFRAGGDHSDFVPPEEDPLRKGRHEEIELDLKSDAARATALTICRTADILLEGFRPGVMERLGLGPEEVMAVNPAIVYGRVTGFGQDGPSALYPGHDINYLAATGALHAIGTSDAPPVPPLNLVADFGGGGLYAAFSILAALNVARQTGQGRVIDVAMQDGATLQMAMTYGMHNAGYWRPSRGANLLDGGAPFYRCYETRDGKYIAVGALEPQFFSALLRLLHLEEHAPGNHLDPSCWDRLTREFADRFRKKTRDDWANAPLASEACVTPVLDLHEAAASGRNRLLSTDGDRIVIDLSSVPPARILDQSI